MNFDIIDVNKNFNLICETREELEMAIEFANKNNFTWFVDNKDLYIDDAFFQYFLNKTYKYLALYFDTSAKRIMVDKENDLEKLYSFKYDTYSPRYILSEYNFKSIENLMLD